MISRQDLGKFFLSEDSIKLGFQAFFIWMLIAIIHFLYESVHEAGLVYLDDLVYGLAACFSLTCLGVFNLQLKNVVLKSQLKKLEELSEIQLLADAIPQIAWVADDSGMVTYINKRWEDYTGRKIKDGLGWRWQEVIHPDDVDHVVRVWSTFTYHNEDFQIRYRLRRFDGVYEWFLVRTRPLIKDDKVLKFFGTLTNIEEYVNSKALFS